MICDMKSYLALSLTTHTSQHYPTLVCIVMKRVEDLIDDLRDGVPSTCEVGIG